MLFNPYLNDILHVGTTEVHGPAVDVVQDQLHVVPLDHGEEDGYHIVALFLVLHQQFLEVGRHRTQDNPVGPETRVHADNLDITELAADENFRAARDDRIEMFTIPDFLCHAAGASLTGKSFQLVVLHFFTLSFSYIIGTELEF